MSDDQAAAAYDPYTESPPPLDYKPMHDESAPDDKEKTYSGESDGLRAAAKEVTKRRAGEDEPVERAYVRDGEAVPDNETIELEKAAADLTDLRKAEAQAAQEKTDRQIKTDVDILRNGEVTQQEAEAKTIEASKEPETEAPRALNEKLVEILQDPEIRQAFEAEVAQVDHARRAFVETTGQAAQLAAANLMAQFPELQGVAAEQLPAALSMLQRQNPARHAEITGHIQKVQAFANAHQQAQQQQAQVEQQRFKTFAAQQDAEFVRAIVNEPPDTVKAVKENLPRIAQEVYGVSPDELRQILDTPLFRTAAAQRMMYDAVKFHVQQAKAKDAMQEKKVRTAPPVMRPGVSNPRTSDDEVDSAFSAFVKNPSLRQGAALLTARRAARR